MMFRRIPALLLSLAMLSACGAIHGSEAVAASKIVAAEAPPQPPGLPTVEKTARGTPLPPYDFPWEDGLYASAAGYLSVRCIAPICAKSETICVDSFCRKTMVVSALVQDHSAPLVVVLLGIGGRPSDQFSRLWPSYFADAGYHVLVFNSTFLQEFNERSVHGVSGNLFRETELVRDLIAAFLDQSDVNGKVTQIGVVGISYGGVEALMLGALSAQKKVPFAISSIQSYSPPLDILHSAKRVDAWYAQTHDQFPLTELLKMQKHVPDRSCPKSPFSDLELKAATAALFRQNLPELIAYNDRVYNQNKLPKGNDFDDEYVRETYANKWGFERFAMGMSYPYWQKELKLKSLKPLIDAAQLPALISAQPPGVTEVILAQDDPFNEPDEMAEFKKFAVGKPVIILPRGGHVGYVLEDWTKAKLLTLFEGH